MPSRPTVTPLPRSHRRIVFVSFLIIFLVAMPALWFYTTGYRFDLDALGERTIVGVGGLYISTDSPDVEFFVDEAQVTKFRIFRKAAYIQDLIAGVHHVSVQGKDLITWTKDLPVSPYIVTEAYAFTMPAIPQIRAIGEYTTATGTQVLKVEIGSSTPFAFASSTSAYVATTSKATTTLIANSEYTYVRGLFKNDGSADSLIDRLSDRVGQIYTGTVVGPVASTTSATSTATTTKEWRSVRLNEDSDHEIQAAWVGGDRERPYYYCVDNVRASSTPLLYGEHVYADMLQEKVVHERASTTAEAARLIEGERVCRDTIRVDRKGSTVLWFDFYPSSSDLVLLLLDDGLYAVEIDDRSWQNTQLIYPGTKLKVALDGGRIFVRDDGLYAEVFTTITQ